MKKLCTDCKARFEVKFDDLEEGDSINCPECNLEYTMILDKKGKNKLIETKILEMEDDSEDAEDPEEDYETEME